MKYTEEEIENLQFIKPLVEVWSVTSNIPIEVIEEDIIKQWREFTASVENGTVDLEKILSDMPDDTMELYNALQNLHTEKNIKKEFAKAKNAKKSIVVDENDKIVKKGSRNVCMKYWVDNTDKKLKVYDVVYENRKIISKELIIE